MSTSAVWLGPLRSWLTRIHPAVQPDRDLLQQFLTDRNETAFAALLQRHGPMVYGLCRRVAGEADADDVFQATFLALARKAGSLRDAAALPAWLHATALRLSLNARRGRERRSSAEVRGPIRAVSTPLDELTGRELLGILDAELHALPERYRLPLILCCLEGRSQDEAAALLGWSHGSVKGRLERGREALRRRLALRGVALCAALGAGLVLTPPSVATTLLQSTLSLACSGTMPPAVATLLGAAAPTMAGRFRALVAVLLLGLFAGSLGLPSPARVPDAPPGAKAAPPRTDAHGDLLPPGAIARLGMERMRAPNSRLALSADGKTIIAVDQRLVVREWDAATGDLRSIRRLSAGPGFMSGLSRDGRRLFWETAGNSGGKKYLEMWDVGTGKQVHTWPLPKDVGYTAVMAAPTSDTAIVLFGTGGITDVGLLDLRAGSQAALFQAAHEIDYIQRSDLSPDGRRLLLEYLAGKTGTRIVEGWDVAEKRRLWQLLDVGGPFAFHPDSTTFVTTSARPGARLELRDAASGRLLPSKTLPPANWRDGASPSGEEPYFEFMPGGQTLLLADHKNGMRFWDLDSAKFSVKAPLNFIDQGHRVVTPDGGAIIALAPTLQRWDLHSGKPQFPDTRDWGHLESLRRLTFSPDGKELASIDLGDGVHLWNLAKAKVERFWLPHQGSRATAAVAFLPDGRLLTAGNDRTLAIWDARTGAELKRLQFMGPQQGQLPHIMGSALTADGKRFVLVLSSRALRVVQTDLETGAQTIAPSALPLNPSPDGRSAFVGRGTSGEGASLIDWTTGRLLRPLEHNEPQGYYEIVPSDAVFSPDGRIVAAVVSRGKHGDNRGTLYLQLWEVGTGRALSSLPVAHHSNCFAFSSDSRLVAASTDDGLVVAEVATGGILRRHPRDIAAVTALAFAPDGRTLAAGYDDTTILLWDIAPTAKAPGDADALWAALLDTDAAKAYAAVWRLAEKPDLALAVLQDKLKRPEPLPAATVRPLLDKLGDVDFRTREAAEKQLRQFGARIEPLLRIELAANPSPEKKRRLEALLAAFEPLPRPEGERLRELRAVWVLERIASTESRQFLASLSTGDPAARLTREAQAALGRVEK